MIIDKEFASDSLCDMSSKAVFMRAAKRRMRKAFLSLGILKPVTPIDDRPRDLDGRVNVLNVPSSSGNVANYSGLSHSAYALEVRNCMTRLRILDYIHEKGTFVVYDLERDEREGTTGNQKQIRFDQIEGNAEEKSRLRYYIKFAYGEPKAEKTIPLVAIPQDPSNS